MDSLVPVYSSARIPVYVLAADNEELNFFVARYLHSDRISIVKGLLSADDAEKTLQYVRTAVVLISYHFYGNRGRELARRLHFMNSELRIAGYSFHYHERQLYSMIDAGALSFFNKDCGYDELHILIEEIATGRRHYNKHFTTRIADSIKQYAANSNRWWLNEISDEEISIAYEAFKGSSDKQAADALGLKLNRVNHVHKQAKLRHHCHNRLDLLRLMLCEMKIKV
jgi:DNA-binding NarL/FixJ family response regulator